MAPAAAGPSPGTPGRLVSPSTLSAPVPLVASQRRSPGRLRGARALRQHAEANRRESGGYHGGYRNVSCCSHTYHRSLSKPEVVGSVPICSTTPKPGHSSHRQSLVPVRVAAVPVDMIRDRGVPRPVSVWLATPRTASRCGRATPGHSEPLKATRHSAVGYILAPVERSPWTTGSCKRSGRPAPACMSITGC